MPKQWKDKPYVHANILQPKAQASLQKWDRVLAEVVLPILLLISGLLFLVVMTGGQ